MNLVSFSFSDVDFFVGLEEDVFFWDKLKKDKCVFTDGLCYWCFFVKRSLVEGVAVGQEV